jgi:hypothetical protein
MEKTTRRMFCGTAFMALPVLTLAAGRKEAGMNIPLLSSEPILETLADEFADITADGAQNQFASSHFRRYAGLIRMLDLQMECRGISGEVDKRLDDDDFHLMNPVRSARFVSDFWRKRNLHLRDEGLLNVDGSWYREGKKRIKKMGGVRALSAQTALLFEIKARQHESASLRGGPYMRQGKILFPRQPEKPLFVNAQYPGPMTGMPDFTQIGNVIGLLDGGGFSILFPDKSNELILNSIGEPLENFSRRLDCLCRFLQLMGAALVGLDSYMPCTPCAIIGAMWIMAEALLESMLACNAERC